ncbi:MAG: alanine racemase [Candidatus Atribacteria bacterium]|nr:alanine racemase [Candidatus Atribacteria bacterium]
MDFLDTTIKRNPNLIRTAVELYRQGKISANTIVVDLDAICHNAKAIYEAANKYNVKLYFMTKQFGRNPEICQVILRAGIDKAVAVDLEDTWCLEKNGVPIGHVGHLVQIPRNDINYVLAHTRPEVMTVFSLEKAKEVNEEAKKLGLIQKILLRVVGAGDFFYDFQYGGIKEENLAKVVRDFQELDFVKIVGVTSFPCFRFNLKTRKVEPLPNLFTILRAAEILEKLGNEVEQINAPADNSTMTMELLAKMGITHAEPGHAFTGTTPWHAFENLPEIPAWIYVTEVSHLEGDKAYVIGGGLMSGDAPLGIWGHLYHAHRLEVLVGDNPENIFSSKAYAEPAGYIDYYGTVHLPRESKVKVSDIIIYGLRNQVFVSRARVAVINGVQVGNPKLVGIFDRMGRRLDSREEKFSMG